MRSHPSGGPGERFGSVTVSVIAPLLLAAMLAGGCIGAAAPGPAPMEAWVGTWGTAPQLVEPANLPPPPGLAGNTLRQVVRVSLGGERLRVRLSNAFGTASMTVVAVHLAESRGGSAVEPTTDRALLFDGQTGVTIPAGGEAVSDPLDFPLRPLSEVAITLRFGDVPAAVTGHPGSRTTSYLQEGDAVSAPYLPAAAQTDRWYVATGLDVVAPGAAAVVTLGNSITDGRGSGTNRQNRWPNELAHRLAADPRTPAVGVLNMGIGGNCVLRECLGPAALDRLERDVLERSGVRWLIVLHGINDIGQADGAAGADAVARDLIDAYREMTERARARGIRVYGATLLPFGGSFYETPAREAARQRVNQWIRTGDAFDAVIDLDAALRDPEAPARLRPDAATGDHLHPNERGHALIAEAIDPALFVR
jgi:lysophospholipase L1-like esterase